MKEAIFQLFTSSTVPSTLVCISLVGLLGILLGRVKIFSIKLGSAGVLFAGLLIGHLGFIPEPSITHFVKEFGLILFVYAIGIDIGPRFISTLRNNGIAMNILAVSIVLLGFICAVALKYIFDIDVEVISGIMSGAVTNTPGLGAAQTVLSEQMMNGNDAMSTAGMAYAVAYPFGVLGIIFVMILLRLVFHIDVKKEEEKYNENITGLSGVVHSVFLEVSNPNIEGLTVAEFQKMVDKEFVFSRLKRNGEFFYPESDIKIHIGDLLYGVSSDEHYDTLRVKVGKLEPTGKIEISGDLTMRHVLVTNHSIVGKTLQQVGLSELYPANITRIFRTGTEILPNKKTTIEFGDTVRVVAKTNMIEEVSNFLGNSQRTLATPNLIPVFIGIFLGVILGSIPIFIPGVPAPAKLGLAGGPLVIALLLGHKGRVGNFDFYMSPAANLFIRELGITLFLAAVGLDSGARFWETIVNGGYVWMGYGVIITFIPTMIIAIIARLRKMNYLVICGILAGATTNPPALEFANSISGVQAQATSYATVYPLIMFLRILMAQLLVLILL